jgi:hypothetical protein
VAQHPPGLEPASRPVGSESLDLSALTGEPELALDLGAGGAAVAVLTALLAAVRRPPDVDVRVVAGYVAAAAPGRLGAWRGVRMRVHRASR